jgi:osmotically-inducible protein OsmY
MIKYRYQSAWLAMLLSLLGITDMILTGCTMTPYQESTGQYIDSSVITAKVKAKLLADEKINGLAITVKTYQNVVQLSGFVNYPSQANRAVELAKSVEGVLSVKNSLVIK